MSAARTFADWALSLRLEDVPEEVRLAAKRHLLDGVGCAIAAARTDAAPYATSILEPGDATVFGTNRRASTASAAMANGILVHALDYDDTHAEGLVHATAAVLPTAFAVGEQVGATGAEVLLAAIAGYEMVTRIGSAVPHGFHARGFHATSVCGVFASALIASRLTGLHADATTSAIGIAGSAAAGSLEFLNTGAATKQIHPGLAAANGIAAARLAAAGAQGPETIFEGDSGLFMSYLGEQIDPDLLTKDLGTRWQTTRITIKPYPACQLSHASLDALRAAGVDDAGSVERIVLTVPDAAVPIVCEPAATKRRPRSAYEAKFSLPWCAAALLIEGRLDVDSFGPQQLGRADILTLANRIVCAPSGYSGPPAQAPGRAEVTLHEGNVRTGVVPCSNGGPDAPLSDEDLLFKLAANFGGDGAAGFAAFMFSLETQPDLGFLR